MSVETRLVARSTGPPDRDRRYHARLARFKGRSFHQFWQSPGACQRTPTGIPVRGVTVSAQQRAVDFSDAARARLDDYRIRCRSAGMPRIGSAFQWIGGRIGAVAGSALLVGLCLVVVGMTPTDLAIEFAKQPPTWAQSGVTRIAILILGLFIIGLSLRFNRWSQQQKAIDDLAEDISWAIHDLLNRTPRPAGPQAVAMWEKDYREWCDAISKKLANRAFFTRADQIHFDRLGFVDPLTMSGDQRFDWLLSQLRMKFDRLRDIINWVQQRRQ